MRREDDPYRNVPRDVMEEIREQEKKRVKSGDGILGGLVQEDEEPRSKPLPPRRIADIRSGHSYT